MNDNKILPGQEHFVLEYDNSDGFNLEVVNVSETTSKQYFWHKLKKRPTFWISLIIILFILFLTSFPFLFTSLDPRHCVLSHSLANPSYGHWFGFDRQGCDIFSRVVYGSRASVLVGIFSTISAGLIGIILGSLSGFYGGWLDAILSRIIDIFFAIPFILAAIVLMQIFKDKRSILMVVFVLSFFGWTSIARIMRSSVMIVKNYEFNKSALSAGQGRFKILLKHVIPNSIGSAISYSMVALGSFIVSEATLSFIGLGLPSSVISWGSDIANAQVILRSKPMVLFYPSIALAITVLSFIMLGDVINDVLNTKNK